MILYNWDGIINNFINLIVGCDKTMQYDEQYYKEVQYAEVTFSPKVASEMKATALRRYYERQAKVKKVKREKRITRIKKPAKKQKKNGIKAIKKTKRVSKKIFTILR